MVFPGGRIAQFIASFGADTCDSYTVVGTAGSLTMDPAYRFESAMRLQQRNQEAMKTDQFPYTDHFAGMTAYFSECIRNGNPPEADGLEGLADLAILLAIAWTFDGMRYDCSRTSKPPFSPIKWSTSAPAQR